MKYIRTKNRVYKVKKETCSWDTIKCDYEVSGYACEDTKNSKHTLYFDNDEILKQADTIEELCDEFVCLENKMTFHDLETITSSCNLKHLTIYGAIWTDKGLIYIAKMNDKGELELL